MRTSLTLLFSAICTVFRVDAQGVGARRLVLGRWIGGLDNDTAAGQLTLTFGYDSAAGLTVDAPRLGLARARGMYTESVPHLAGGAVKRKRSGFTIVSKVGAPWRLDGLILGDTQVVGQATLPNGVNRTFRLLHIVPEDSLLERDAEGTYDLGLGRMVYLERVNAFGIPSLLYLDDGTGRIGQLRAVGGARYLAGSSTFSDFPVDLRVELLQDPTGRVRAMRWHAAGEATKEARKVTQYEVHDVTFKSGAATLRGTTYAPLAPGRYPGVVFVHGSGPADRRLYAPYAQYLARHGIVALVYDKRGTGQSTGGEWQRATFDMLTDDALAAVETIRQRADVDSTFVGIHGSSQGGWIGPLGASRSHKVGFVIMQSGAVVNPAEQETYRITSAVRLNGGDSAAVEATRAAWEVLFDYSRNGRNASVLDSTIAVARAVTPSGTELPVLSEHARMGNRWYLYLDPFLDAEGIFARVRVPVLAVYGDRDMFVPIERSVAAIRRAAAIAHNAEIDVHVFPAANHSLTNSLTGGIADTSVVRRYAPGYLPLMAQWILAHADERRLVRARHSLAP